MFERFTDKARRVVALAQDEARMLDHTSIGTEHILLGLLALPDASVAGSVLLRAGMTVEGVRAEVERVAGRGTTKPRGHVPFSPAAKRTLEIALREALKLNHNYIGTEHLLLALLTAGESVAQKILIDADVSEAEARTAILEILLERGAAIGGGSDVTAAFEKAGRKRARRKLEALPHGPRCAQCGESLLASASYKIASVPEHGGDGKAQVLYLFCGGCGHLIDNVILPE